MTPCPKVLCASASAIAPAVSRTLPSKLKKKKKKSEREIHAVLAYTGVILGALSSNHRRQ